MLVQILLLLLLFIFTMEMASIDCYSPPHNSKESPMSILHQHLGKFQIDLDIAVSLRLPSQLLRGSTPESVRQHHLNSNDLSTGGDRTALVALYNATNNQLPWNVSSSSVSHCSWTGVQCFGASMVVSIDISSMELTGTLPSQIGMLPTLAYLNTSHNYLSGTIPSTIGALGSLQILDLRTNQFSGSIPSGLFQLSNLLYVSMCENSLTGQIPAVTTPSLQLLALCLNQLSGNIPSFPQPSSIKAIDLSQNQISGSYPIALFSQTQLLQLNLGANPLTGTIPTQIGQLTNLLDFRTWGSTLHGTIPTEVGLLKSLIVFIIFTSQISGTFPITLTNCTNLVLFGVPDNRLRGTLPTELGQLTSVSLAAFWKNSFSGTVPTQLGNMRQLQMLGLQENQFSGCIPTELGMTPVVNMYLQNNNFNCTLPTQILFSKYISLLQVFNNQLTGTLPSIPSALNIQQFSISRNMLCGTIPPSIRFMTRLNYLDLSSNRLRGTIPKEMGQCTMLEMLAMYKNQLTGGLPSTFAKLTSLTIFDASENQLNGSLSGFLQPLLDRHIYCIQINMGQAFTSAGCTTAGLQVLNLQRNLLSGTIPSDILVLFNAFLILLGENPLRGTLPEILLKTILKESGGGMSGGAFGTPDWYVLDISHSGITGEIPETWGRMPRLRMLNLSQTTLNAPELPQWMTVSGNKVGDSETKSDCPVITGSYRPIAVFMDATYYNYTLCNCFDGLYKKNGVCVACPLNTVCSGGEVSVKKGWWGTVTSDGSIETYPCPPGYCQENSSYPLWKQCVSGRTGILCGDCIDGYVKMMGSTGCISAVECSGDGLILGLTLVITLVFALYLMQASFDQYPGSTWNDMSAVLKILTYFYQIVPLLLSEQSLQDLGSGIEVIYDLLNLKPNAGTTNVCGFKSMTIVQKKLMVLFVPCCLIFWLGAITLGIFLRRKYLLGSGNQLRIFSMTQVRKFPGPANPEGSVNFELQGISFDPNTGEMFLVKSRHTRIIQSHKGTGPVSHVFTPCVHCFFTVLGLAYATVLRTVFELLLCVRIDGVLHLQSVGSVECYTVWQGALFVFLLPLLGYPFILFYIVYRLQNAKNQPGGLGPIGQTTADALTRLFNPSFPQWEGMLMFRRLVYVSLFTFLADSLRWRSWLFSVISIGVAVHTMVYQPYLSVNWVETTSLFVLAIISLREIANFELQIVSQEITSNADAVGFRVITNMLIYGPLCMYGLVIMRTLRNVVRGMQKRRKQKKEERRKQLEEMENKDKEQAKKKNAYKHHHHHHHGDDGEGIGKMTNENSSDDGLSSSINSTASVSHKNQENDDKGMNSRRRRSSWLASFGFVPQTNVKVDHDGMDGWQQQELENTIKQIRNKTYDTDETTIAVC